MPSLLLESTDSMIHMRTHSAHSSTACRMGVGRQWILTYRMAGNFHGKFEKALKINIRGFKFRDSNQSRGMALLHKR